MVIRSSFDRTSRDAYRLADFIIFNCGLPPLVFFPLSLARLMLIMQLPCLIERDDRSNIPRSRTLQLPYTTTLYAFRKLISFVTQNPLSPYCHLLGNRSVVSHPAIGCRHVETQRSRLAIPTHLSALDDRVISHHINRASL